MGQPGWLGRGDKTAPRSRGAGALCGSQADRRRSGRTGARIPESTAGADPAFAVRRRDPGVSDQSLRGTAVDGDDGGTGRHKAGNGGSDGGFWILWFAGGFAAVGSRETGA